MTSSGKFLWLGAALLSLLLTQGQATAGIVLTFNDLGASPTVDVATTPPTDPGSIFATPLGPDTIDVLIFDGVGLAAPTQMFAYTFTDPVLGNGYISNYVLFRTFLGSGLLFVDFVSATEGGPTLTVPAGFAVFGSAVATGQTQAVPLPPSLVTTTPVGVLVILDAQAVPTPSTLALSAIGLPFGLALWRSGRKQATAIIS